MGWIDRLLEQPATADAARDTFRRALRAMCIQIGLLFVFVIADLVIQSALGAPASVWYLAFFMIMIGQSAFMALDAKSAYHRLAQSSDA